MNTEDIKEKLRFELDYIYCYNCAKGDDCDDDMCHRKYMGWRPSDGLLDKIIDVCLTGIVRCEDCRHYKQSDVTGREMCFRKDVDGMPVCYDFTPDDWCKYGERKEE